MGKIVFSALIFQVALYSSELSVGIEAYNAKNYPVAIQHLTVAAREDPLLADYTSYYLSSSRMLSGDSAGAQRALDRFGASRTVLSPLGSKGALLKAQIALQLHDTQGAIATLRDFYESLHQPEGDLLLAQSYEAQKERLQAAALYQRVYFLRPATQAATAASGAIDRLKTELGKDYPPPAPALVLARADAWLASKNYSKARAEYKTLHGQLIGLERDQAEVRMWWAAYLAGEVLPAQAALEKLHIAHSEADAERLYDVVESSRKLGDEAAMNATVDALAKHYPSSPWRLKALITAANQFLVKHDIGRYTPLFTAACEAFPPDVTTAGAHWKITWDAYLGGSANARSLLQEQIRRYPFDNRAASALYFMGRLSEEAKAYGDAKEIYGTLLRVYPNYYYGVLAAAKLKEKLIASAGPAVDQWLTRVDFPSRPDINNEAPNAVTRAHIERAKLLMAAGLSDWAQVELRFGADTDGQKHLLAIEIAREDANPALALRHMKSLAPEYLSLPLENAPREFWKFLFPFPFRESLTSSAQAQGIDPYLLAGLIRQESEFNPAAVSRANALGLTQLIPGTGRMMARGQGLAAFNSTMLFRPDVSLRLGAAYLKIQLNNWNGNLEQTLAAYNAGPGRVKEWLTWGTYREPAEFVESIPFTETREYVQAVLRNASVYRRLYEGKVDPPTPDPKPASEPVRKAVRKKTAKRHVS